MLSIWKRLGLTIFTFLAALSYVAPASAIPAFARRYETSCQTCHLAFPKLTPFGEAFRRNGYRFPGGGDATAVKEEGVTLGNDAQRERWPAAVTPGEIPGRSSLSVVVDGKAIGGPHPEQMAEMTSMAGMPGMTTSPGKLGLDTFGGHVGLRAAAPIGEMASVFASVDVGGMEPVSVERGWLDLTPAGPTALHLRLGRFEPSLHGISIHRGLFAHQLRLTTTAVGSNPFTPEHSQTGAEASGVALGRIGWAAGVVENAAGNRTLRKDFYGRLEYKLGGMRLDGLQAQAETAAWRERSVLLGFSAYSGQAEIDVNAMPVHTDQFLRLGADLHVVVDDWLLDLVAVQQQHSQPTEIDNAKQTMQLAFAELTWVATAVLFPTARVEASRIDHDNTRDSRWLGSALLTYVLRPNVLLRVAGEIGSDEKSTDHTGFRSAVLSFATAF